MNIADLMIQVNGNIELSDLIPALTIQTDSDLVHWSSITQKPLQKANNDFFELCKKYNLKPEKVFFTSKGFSAYYYVDLPIVFELYDFTDSPFLEQALLNKAKNMNSQFEKYMNENSYGAILFFTPTPFQKMVFHDIY